MIISEKFTPEIEVKVGTPTVSYIQLVLTKSPDSPVFQLHEDQWRKLNEKVVDMFDALKMLNKPFVPAALTRG